MEPGRPSASPSLVVASHGLALVGIVPERGDTPTGPAVLLASTDLTHWRDVTPARVATGPDADGASFEAASILDSRHWWLTTYDPARALVTIYRTSNGGRTWTSVPGGTHSASSPSITYIQLINASLAWREILQPTGPGMALSVTEDAGRAWRTVYTGPPHTTRGGRLRGPFEMPMVFAGRARGFGGEDLSNLNLGPSISLSGDFFRTRDGGRHWTRQTPPRPAGSPACPRSDAPSSPSRSACLDGLPTFFAADHAVVADISQRSTSATIGFDLTTDTGTTWSLEASHKVASGARELSGRIYPLVSMATPTAWWIESASASHRSLAVTSDGGVRWVSSTLSLPPGYITELRAVSATAALLVDDVRNSFRLYRTLDQGRTWTSMDLPTRP